MTKELHVEDDTVYVEARRAEQPCGHNITGKRQRQKLHEISTGKRRRFESSAPGGTFQIDIKVEDGVMKKSGSAQSFAKVGISNADSDTTVLMEAVSSYCHTPYVRSNDSLETLEAIHVSLQEKVDCSLQNQRTIFFMRLGSRTPSMTCLQRRTLATCLI